MTSSNRVRLTVALLVASPLLFTGCASRSAPTGGGRPGSVARADRAATDEYPLILRLVGRHYTVTASSGPDGVVYSAEGTDGRLVVANATLDDLRRRHPEVYQQLLPGIATQGDGANTRRRDTAEDASIEGPIPMGHVSQPASGLGMRGQMLMLHSAQ